MVRLKPPMFGMPASSRHHGHAAASLFLLPPVTSPCVPTPSLFESGARYSGELSFKKYIYSGEPRATRHQWLPPSGREGRRRAFAVRSTWSVSSQESTSPRAPPAGCSGPCDRRPAKGKPSRPVALNWTDLPFSQGRPPRRGPLPVTHQRGRHGTARHRTRRRAAWTREPPPASCGSPWQRPAVRPGRRE